MKEYYKQGLEIRGKRKMTFVGEESGIPEWSWLKYVPVDLLPLERSILTILAFSQDKDITGNQLSKRFFPKNKKVPSKIYKTLTRLRKWGYVDHTVKGYTIEPIGAGRTRNLNFITQRGIERLKQDYES